MEIDTERKNQIHQPSRVPMFIYIQIYELLITHPSMVESGRL